jgi:hypothetical protein
MTSKNDTSNATCPKCGSADIIPIGYGLPTEEAFKKAHRGLLVLGGCLVGAGMPQKACKRCEHRFDPMPDLFSRGGQGPRAE